MSVRPTPQELEELAPFCPCRLCTQTWLDSILNYFTRGNCPCCAGCLKSELYSMEYVEMARKAKAADSAAL